jgi:GNAT superfamily N-acetyltransferase
VFVAEVDGRVIGFVSAEQADLDDLADGTGQVGAIYLLEAFAGHGIGLALMDAALAFLSSIGCPEAVLWVLAPNSRARRFYEEHGWHVEPRTKEERPGGVILREVR